MGDYVESHDLAQEALGLYRDLCDLSGEADGLYELGSWAWRLGKLDPGRAFLGSALELYRRLGNRAGEANKLNVLGNLYSSSDLGKALACFEQGLAAFEAVGNRERISTLRGNLATTYLSFGLVGRALKELDRVAQMEREMGTRLGLAYSLDTRGSAHRELGDVALAELEIRESLALAQETGNRLLEGECLTNLGRVLLAAGRPAEARDSLLAAAELDAELDVPDQAFVLAELGAAQLALGDANAARQATGQAIAWLEAHGHTAGEQPTQDVWWWRYQALDLTPQPPSLGRKGETFAPPLLGEGSGERSTGGAPGERSEAWHALDQARAAMLAVVANLSDDGLRRSYFNKITSSRQIIQTWLAEARRRGLSLEPLTSALRGPGGGELQFRRLLDIGVRLNARRDPAGLSRFIVDEVTGLIGAERAELILIPEGEQGQRPAAPSGLEAMQALLDEAAAKRAALLRHIPEDAPELDQRSVLCVPLITSGKLVGLLFAELSGIYGRLTEQDRDLLSMLANQAAVAVENARWTDTLERRVEERTAELDAANRSLEQRLAELAVINSVQQGLAAHLEMQAIFELVGDTIQRTFNAQVAIITTYDLGNRLAFMRYGVEKGQRVVAGLPRPLNKLHEHLIRTRQLVLINEDADRRMDELGLSLIPGTEEPKSALFVPLIMGGEVTGHISLQNLDRENAFSEADVRLLSTLAASMNVALENARLFEETRRLLAETEQRAGELAVINSVQQGLAAKLETQAIIDLVGDKLCEVLGTDSLSIRLYDRQANLVSWPYAVEEGSRVELPPMTPSGISAHVLRTCRPLVINQDMEARSAELGSFTLPGTAVDKSLAAVPIIAGGHPIGLISVSNYERENAFSDSDVRVLTTLAASLGVSLENVCLFEQTRSLLAETERRNAELAVINRVGQKLAAELDPQEIYEVIGEELHQVFDAQVVSIVTYDRAANLVHWRYAIEKGERLTVASRPPTGFTGHILKTRQPLLIGRELAARAAELGSTVVAGEWPKSYLGVPLIAGGEAIAVVTLQNLDREEAFDEADLRLLQTLSLNMGVALENARLFAEIQRQQRFSESLVQTSPVAIVTTDERNRVTSWNPAAERLFGYQPEEAVGKTLDGLITDPEMPELWAEAQQFTKEALAGGSFHAITKRRRRDGSLVDVEIFSAPVAATGQDSAAQPQEARDLRRILAIYHDLTELKRSEQELRREIAQATALYRVSQYGKLSESLEETLSGLFDGVLEAGTGVEAVFAVNDEMALAAVETADGLGYPDFPAVGYNASDRGRAGLRAGKLSATIGQDLNELGRRGVIAALQALEGLPTGAEVLLPVQLIAEPDRPIATEPAVMLVASRSYTLGVALGDYETNAGYREIRDGVLEGAAEAGVKLTLVGHHETRAMEQAAAVEAMLAADVDALILVPLNEYTLAPVAQRALARGIPVVTLDQPMAGVEVSAYVGADNRSGGRAWQPVSWAIGWRGEAAWA